MSNIKEVKISGYIPFDTNSNPAVCRILGQLNQPSNGLRINYDSTRTKVMPNRDASRGETVLYYFCVYGEEAVGDGWLQMVLTTFLLFGVEFVEFKFKDLENDGQWITFANRTRVAMNKLLSAEAVRCFGLWK